MSNSPPPETAPLPSGTEGAPQSVQQRRNAGVRQIARFLAQKDEPAITNGDLAALRRMRDGSAPPAAFWRIVVDALEPRGLVTTLGDERKWTHIVRLMAEAAGLHVNELPLGKALSDAKVAETRVLRVLNAQGDQLIDALRYALRPLVVGGVRFDQRAIAELILSDGHQDASDRARNNVARSFFSAEHTKSKPDSQ